MDNQKLIRPEGYDPSIKKKEYPIYAMYHDGWESVPGWINDAVWIYEDVVKSLPKNAHVVEVGCYLGQSTTRMAQLLHEHNREDVKFDSIDSFYIISHAFDNATPIETIAIAGDKESVDLPPSYLEYYNSLKSEFNCTIVDMVKHPLRVLKIEKYVNFICIDSYYAHRLYDDETLDFVWLDANHQYEYIYHELNTLWPKIKKGGILAGDDYNDKEVQKAVSDVLKKHKPSYFETNDLSFYMVK
tara:strand:- start:1792 stop:2520 length:729 start_codon:yes stop_codon:yes gene_type:complete